MSEVESAQVTAAHFIPRDGGAHLIVVRSDGTVWSAFVSGGTQPSIVNGQYGWEQIGTVPGLKP